MQYDHTAKNTGKDLIYQTRLRLIYKSDFDINKTAKRYNYFIDAYLGIILF